MKVGLDDFIVAEGAEALEALLAATPAYVSVAALHDMNEEVLIVRSMNQIVQRSTGYIMGKGPFCEVAYAHRTHIEETPGKDGVMKKLRVPTAAAWLKWPGRASVDKLVFAPGKERVVNGDYNTWHGWKYEPNPAAGLEPWHALMRYALEGLTTQQRVWFEQWCAYPIQNPGAKLATACVFYGLQEGTGKTLIGVTLKELYGEYGEQIGQSTLQNERAEWAVNKQFVLGDEVTGSDRFNMVDRLKGMITQKELRVDQKYVPSYTIKDCINYFFTSNRCNAFIMSGKDRRYFVVEMNNDPLPAQFYLDYETWLNNGGAAALMHHLSSVNLKGFNAQGVAPTTHAKMEMELLGRSDLDDWCQNVADHAPATKDAYTASELLMLFDPDGRSNVKLNTMGRALKTAGVWQPSNGLPFKHEGKSWRLYVVRNVAKWKKEKQGAIALNSVQPWSKKYA